jgi:hypothetical protein
MASIVNGARVPVETPERDPRVPRQRDDALRR